MGGLQQGAVGILVLWPLFAHLDIAHAELPVFQRVVDAFLQALALLVEADVQQELDDDGAGFHQHALEIVDVGITLAGLLGRDPLVDGGHQHVFVMAAIEDHPFPGAGHGLVDAPEEIVGTFVFGGRFPAPGVYTQRAGAAEDATQGAVLAGGVGALQHDQQLVALVHVEALLELVQLGGQRVNGGLVTGFVARGERFGCRVEILQLVALVTFGDARLPGGECRCSERLGSLGFVVAVGHGTPLRMVVECLPDHHAIHWRSHGGHCLRLRQSLPEFAHELCTHAPVFCASHATCTGALAACQPRPGVCG